MKKMRKGIEREMVEVKSVNKSLGGEKKKMKTKNKMIALIEIAVVLCSVFLVALPTIAAEQNAQKASESTITTSSENDYVLGVYGNANEDDTIDMRDLTYVKLIFFGKKPVTELADAKYDGKINPLDFIQIKLIIVGKEKELTIVDDADRIVTVKKPIERIVIASFYLFEGVQILGRTDKVVGVTTWIPGRYHFFIPEVNEIPVVNYKDYEAILNLNPDLVTTMKSRAEEAAEKLPGVAAICLDIGKQKRVQEGMTKLGYILDKEDEAKHYIDDFRSKYIGSLRARTKGLSEEERPKVYVEAFSKPYKTYSGSYDEWMVVEIAGGRDIFSDIGSGTTVDPEAVLSRNPDVIIKKIKRADAGYGFEIGDTSKIKAIREEVMNRPELAEVAAVKEGRVYALYGDLTYGLDHPIAMAYYAKWIHPDIFKDLDPKAIHQEYLTEFMGAGYDLDKHGVFVYPEEPV